MSQFQLILKQETFALAVNAIEMSTTRPFDKADGQKQDDDPFASEFMLDKMVAQAEQFKLTPRFDFLNIPYDNHQEYYFMFPDAWHIETPVVVETPQFITKTVYSLYKMVQAQAMERLMHAFGLEDKWYARLAKFAIFDIIFTLYAGGLTHEIAGHGWRSKESGNDRSYSLNLFKGEFGQGAVTKVAPNHTVFQDLLCTVEGTASTQNASKLSYKDMRINGGDHIKAHYYLDTKWDITAYIWIWNNPNWSLVPGQDFKEDFQGSSDQMGDISSYWFGSGSLRYQELLDKGYLPEEISRLGLYKGPGFSFWTIYMGALWNFVDPTAIYLAYQMGNYVINGDDKFAVPDYLPRTNYYMTPYGSWYEASMPFYIKDAVMEAGIHTTANTEGLEQSAGGWIELQNLRLQPHKYARFDMGGKLHVFNLRGKWGALFETSIVYSPLDTVGIGGKIGYKPKDAYLPGYPMDSLIWGIDIVLRY
ncbi:MAG: hypothetical protein ABIJ26_00025 [Candidatus Margulisiibacteriota bacterium]|nr:hypothetical protein [Candidatus Margulisiibacteriota bacterium]